MFEKIIFSTQIVFFCFFKSGSVLLALTEVTTLIACKARLSLWVRDSALWPDSGMSPSF